MGAKNHVSVAILLATYNGARFVERQIRSLKENDTPFTLHWLDDQSTDDTRDVVRRVAIEADVPFLEWHQLRRQGPWIGFYQLMECVEADVYLFCDQDDIWQPGKIDVTVGNLLPDLHRPALCFSDPWTFKSDEPEVLQSTYGMLGQTAGKAVGQSRIFMSPCTFGHTEGFTRALRDVFMSHKEIARTYSMGHDWWIYLLAVATGTATLLSGVPTTLYRRHGSNFSDLFLVPKGNRLVWMWRLQQMLRRSVARQAQGFILAAPALPQGPQLERVLEIAHLVADLGKRQSVGALVHLARRRALWPSWKWAFPFVGACLCSDAKDPDRREMAYES